MYELVNLWEKKLWCHFHAERKRTDIYKYENLFVRLSFSRKQNKPGIVLDQLADKIKA